MLEQPSSSRPPRNAPVRRLADEDEGPQHASKKKPATKRAADDEADPPNINPRTKKPYVRGGPDKLPKTPGAAPIARTVRQVSNVGDDRASERSTPELYSRLKDENDELKKKVAALELDKVKLEAELNAVKTTCAMAVKLARAEESSVSQKALHEKYVEGIRMGQSMAGVAPAFSPPQFYHSQGGSSADHHTSAQHRSSYDDSGYSQQQQQPFRVQERF